MSKKNRSAVDGLDDEFFAQLDFLRADYDSISEELEQAKKDIRKLLSELIEKDIPVPPDILDRYVRKVAEGDEKLPFN